MAVNTTKVEAVSIVRLHTDAMYRAGIAWYRALVPVTSEGLMQMTLNQNIRQEMDGLTSINKEVLESLDEEAELFALLNGGLVVTADTMRVDGNTIVLSGGSILDGAQTRKVLRHYLAENETSTAMVSIEFIKASQDVVERLTFTRNTRHPVSQEAFSNRLGSFEFLRDALQAAGETGEDWEFDVDGTKPSAWGMYQFAKVAVMSTHPQLLTDVGCPPKSSLYSGGKKRLLDILFYCNYAVELDSYLAACALPVNATTRKDYAEDFRAFAALRKDLADNCVSAWKQYLEFRGDNPFVGTKARMTKYMRRRRVDGALQDVMEIPDALIFPLLHGLSYVRSDPRSGGERYWPAVVRAVISSYQAAALDITATGKSPAAYSSIDNAAEILGL